MLVGEIGVQNHQRSICWECTAEVVSGSHWGYANLLLSSDESRTNNDYFTCCEDAHVIQASFFSWQD
jgi:hypothetical protein